MHQTNLRERLAKLAPSSRLELVHRLRTAAPIAQALPEVWFEKPDPEDQLRLFCFPYAGSGASVFRPWQDAMPDGVKLIPAHLPGRDERAAHPPTRTLSAQVEQMHHAIEPLLDRPFALFGHSMGALLAFELARALRESGSPRPLRLFLSAFRAPHLPNPNFTIHHLPDEVLKTVLLKDGTAPEIVHNVDIMRALLPTLRADFELCETYCHEEQPPLDVPIRAFGGLQDVRVPATDLEPWREHTSRDFALQTFTGDHFFVHSARDLLVTHLVDDLTACLAHL
ncbi:MAG: thioesterase domain-containing protein [Brachybacterium sp.]|nr:thioesterase domain-containing protein [Brachybacterium sp.]